MIGPVFIIGTGRSGTHLLAHSLESHPDVHATIEAEPMFGLSTRMALNPELEEQLFEELVQAYQEQLSQSAPRLYLDKSHPNIWLVEKLKGAFPQSLFIGIERGSYATVASMMKHSMASEWPLHWREFPVPNHFLGITEELAAIYDDLPLASQCALRWVAHRDRMNRLREVMGDDLLVISYESFVCQTAQVLCELQSFLELHDIPMPEIKTEPLYKWREQLSDEEIGQITDIVTDLARWERVAQGTPSWHGRSQIIAQHIPTGSTVLDIGAGAQTLEQYLAPGCEYQPCDIVAGLDVLFCDFNTGDWSAIEQTYDCVVCAGVLEHVENLPAFLKTVCEFFTHEILVSYNPFRPGIECPEGWVNRFTQAELETLFDAAGLGWAQVDEWQDQLIYRARKL